MSELSYDEEILDVVDINDNVIGQITHEQAFSIKNDGSGYLRAVNAFIINADGKLWIPRRTADKRIAPNGLDFSVGEHVMSGESYDDAIVRGFDEELNMRVSMGQLALLNILKPQPDDAPYLNAIYVLHSDVEPKYNLSDFVSSEWISPTDLMERLRNGELGKRSLVEAVEVLRNYSPKNSSD